MPTYTPNAELISRLGTVRESIASFEKNYPYILNGHKCEAYYLWKRAQITEAQLIDMLEERGISDYDNRMLSIAVGSA